MVACIALATAASDGDKASWKLLSLVCAAIGACGEKGQGDRLSETMRAEP
jgi:hypothetical protein